jgi:phytanoyl-CoA hydroxylase
MLISDRQVEQFRDEGYFVTEPMWEQDQIKRVSDEIDRLLDQNMRATDADPMASDKDRELARLRPFIGHAHMDSDELCEFIKSPIYLEACAKLIGPDADLFYNQIVVKAAEKGLAFGWHQDSGYQQTEPLAYITCWTAITRAHVENGGIWLIPGSHKRGLMTHKRNEKDSSKDADIQDDAGAIPIELERGQVAIFSSLTLHKSGPNRSSDVRKSYVVQYHVPGLINKRTGKTWGDCYPVLRDGERVNVTVPEPVTG